MSTKSIHEGCWGAVLRRLRVAVLFAALSLPVAPATGQPTVDLKGADLVVSGATPGGEVVLVGLAREMTDLLPTTVVHEESLTDDDADGGVTFTIGTDKSDAVLLVFDVENGEYAGIELGRAKLITTPTDVRAADVDKGDQLKVHGDRIRFAVLRPAIGLWSLTVADGLADDADAKRDGSASVSADMLQPVGKNTDTAPRRLGPGDLLIGLNGHTFEYFVHSF